MMFCKAPVSFRSGVQNLTAMSTMEAELVAGALAMKEVVFCSNILIEVDFGKEFEFHHISTMQRHFMSSGIALTALVRNTSR